MNGSENIMLEMKRNALFSAAFHIVILVVFATSTAMVKKPEPLEITMFDLAAGMTPESPSGPKASIVPPTPEPKSEPKPEPETKVQKTEPEEPAPVEVPTPKVQDEMIHVEEKPKTKAEKPKVEVNKTLVKRPNSNVKKPEPNKKQNPKPEPNLAKNFSENLKSKLSGSVATVTAGGTGGGGGLPSQYGWYVNEVGYLLKGAWIEPGGIPGGTQVTIIVTILKDGTISNARVKIPSSFPALDQSAVSAARKLGKVTPLPAQISGSSAEIQFIFEIPGGAPYVG